jgi:hypothetical protein
LLRQLEERRVLFLPECGGSALVSKREILQDRMPELRQSDRYRFSNKGYAEENTGSIFGFDARSDGCAYYELYERNPGFK